MGVKPRCQLSVVVMAIIILNILGDNSGGWLRFMSHFEVPQPTKGHNRQRVLSAYCVRCQPSTCIYLILYDEGNEMRGCLPPGGK